VAIGSSKSNFLGANEDQELVGLFGLSYPNIGSYDVPVENTYDVASNDKKKFLLQRHLPILYSKERGFVYGWDQFMDLWHELLPGVHADSRLW